MDGQSHGLGEADASTTGAVATKNCERQNRRHKSLRYDLH